MNISQSTGFEIKNQEIVLKGNSIKIIHKTPVLTSREKEKRRQEAEHGLYDVFNKYQKSS